MKRCLYFIGVSALSVLLSGCLENSLPKCDAKETTQLFADIITKGLKEDGYDVKYISADDIKEIGFNKEKDIRVCQVNVLYSDGDKERVTYNVYWSDLKKKDYFYVEIVN